MSSRRSGVPLLVALLLLSTACYGDISGDQGDLGPGDDDDATTSDDDDSAPDDDDDDDDSAPADSDGDGWVDAEDCAPEDPAIHPEAVELCNGLDDDCDGQLSAEDPDERDQDLDGIPVCAGDCDDSNPDIRPGAKDSCDGIDSDCDGYPEDVATGDPQEMFISGWGHLYITILSVDAGCDIYLAMDQPVPVADMVGEVHSAIGVEVDVGAVLPCTQMLFTATSCGTPFSTTDPAAFHVIPLGVNHWRLEHEDSVDADFNDLVFEAVVEPRDNTPG